MRLTLFLLLSTLLFAQAPRGMEQGPGAGTGNPRVFHPSQAQNDELNAFLKSLEQSANAADAAAYVKDFTDDAEFTAADGQVYQGRDRIQAHLAQSFRAAKGAKVKYTVRQLHFVRPKVVICELDATVTKANSSSGQRTRLTYVLTKEHEWMVAFGQETARH